jgi:hypothetical protein
MLLALLLEDPPPAYAVPLPRGDLLGSRFYGNSAKKLALKFSFFVASSLLMGNLSYSSAPK